MPLHCLSRTLRASPVPTSPLPPTDFTTFTTPHIPSTALSIPRSSRKASAIGALSFVTLEGDPATRRVTQVSRPLSRPLSRPYLGPYLGPYLPSLCPACVGALHLTFPPPFFLPPPS